MSNAIRVRATVRSRPMVAAAARPRPITSPTISAVRPLGSATTSNQSPPTAAGSAAGS
ncbi:hypothetical protein SVIOM342S_06647 [Streptomyces violaceorubidus]